MTFAQRRNRLTTHFSEHITVVKRRISAFQSEVRDLDILKRNAVSYKQNVLIYV